MDTAERDEIAAGELYPLMAEQDRRRRLADLDTKIGHTRARWLPSERREYSLTLFAARRATGVRELRAEVAARRAELEEAKGRSERAALRKQLDKDTRRLEFLEAIPPLAASDMCPDAPHRRTGTGSGSS